MVGRRYADATVEGAAELPPPEIACWSVDLAQRTGLVREIACAQRLHAGVVLTVERRDCARAARLRLRPSAS